MAKYCANHLQLPIYVELESLPVDEQFGHSTATSNQVYGRHDGKIRNTREHILYNFLSLSLQWKAFIRGCDEKWAAVPKSAEPVQPVQDIPVQNPMATQSFITVLQSKESLDKLRCLLNDQTVEFRSPELRAAVDSVLNSNGDLLAILPTGCGKSLIFQMYAYKHTILTSLVIVPTLSLTNDRMRRAQSLGIKCSDNSVQVSSQQLIFVTPEAAAGGPVRDLIIELYSQKRLGAIFIDKVHLFSLQSQFRPTFRQLPQLKFVNFPLVLLTATAPQWIVEDIILAQGGCLL